ncbi:b(0,+)-type amino acid transporter 1-like isoform X2 [Mya arenaria]|uniref:b(0,+)-type amino acid transporter 1-like isoform X2 n=1 Tax=Mya arenaria TaxID=6604 RepID=UPI0022E57CCD|nr:b(0,+)-type amino acid transporter 1-like isoform X2 [Mya arenaria]XP_052819037.1 b(0,+)-type amino acid transporter 1-like isoform X2 [Mya arenaria]
MSGVEDSESPEPSRPQSDCQETGLNMKDLLALHKIMNNTVVVNEEPVRNGVKNIELRDISKLGYTPVYDRDDDMDKYTDKYTLGMQKENMGLVSSPSESFTGSSESVYSREHVAMKKGVGLLSGVALIVGTMIGSGIFISPKGVLASSGSVGASLIIWTLCGFIALLGALSYAELGTMITKSGAEYAYLQEAFSPLHRTLGPIPSFLFAWTSVLILKPALFGVTAMSFAVYAVEPFYGKCGHDDTIVKIVACLCLFLITFINAYSVDLATKVQNLFTIMKLVAVAIIIAGGVYMLSTGSTEHLNTGFEDTTDSFAMFALAFYDGLWAYDGWNNLNYITEELKNPSRNLPLAIMIGIPLVTVCYILMNVSYFTVLSKYDLLLSNAVASSWGDVVLGGATLIIPLAVVLSAFGGCNGTCFTGGRVMYVAAREGHLPEVFSYIHVTQLTPLPSLIVSVILACVLVLAGEIFALIDFFSFTAWFFYGLTMASLIVLRVTQKDRPRPYKVPIIVPVIVLLVSVYLVVAPIIQDPRIEFLYAFLFSVSGLIFYVPFVLYGKKIKYMQNITYLFQVVLMVAPSKYVPTE